MVINLQDGHQGSVFNVRSNTYRDFYDVTIQFYYQLTAFFVYKILTVNLQFVYTQSKIPAGIRLEEAQFS